MLEFESLKTKLDQLDFPNVYYFKFIVPNKLEHISSVKSLFQKVSDAQYITEIICEHKAKRDRKDLHYRFWLNKEW